MSEICRTRLVVNTGRKNSPFAHHHTTLSGYIFATKACIDNRKKLLSSNISSTCPHNMVNFGQLAAEMVSLVCGTPANFNGFRVLTCYAGCRSTEANQILQDVWPSPGLVRYIHFRDLLPPDGILPRTKFTLCPSMHHRTSFSGYIFATKASIDNRKKLIKQ